MNGSTPRPSGNRSEHGMSLVELVVAMAIFAILAAFAYPAYQGQMREARRADGQTILLAAAARQDRWFYSNGTYTTSMSDLGYSVDGSGNADSSEGYYKVAVVTPTASCPISSCYVLRATPQGGQASDGIMELTSTGIQRRDKNNDGDTSDAGEDSWGK